MTGQERLIPNRPASDEELVAEAVAFVDEHGADVLAPRKPFGDEALQFFFRLSLLRCPAYLGVFVLMEVLKRNPE